MDNRCLRPCLAFDIAVALPEEQPTLAAASAVSASALPRKGNAHPAAGSRGCRFCRACTLVLGTMILPVTPPLTFGQDPARRRRLCGQGIPAAPANPGRERARLRPYVSEPCDGGSPEGRKAPLYRQLADPRPCRRESPEKCQHRYDEPCALVAVNDTVAPAGAAGVWPVTDAPRVRYSGTFRPDQIPGLRRRGPAAEGNRELSRRDWPQGGRLQRVGVPDSRQGTASQRAGGGAGFASVQG